MTQDSSYDVVAYYYPGWHTSSWKPVDEWSLLAARDPYFDGHEPLDVPLDGPYDDRSPEVLSAQINTAQRWGVTAFSFFLYFGTAGYVLDQPTRTALDLAAMAGFRVGVTWCLRLPHQYFPIPLADDDAPLALPEQVSITSVRHTPLLRDLVPPELMDTSAVTIAELMSRDTDDATHGRTVMTGEAALAEEPESVLKMYASPTIRQVLDFLSGVRAIAGQEGVSLLDLERLLALNGMLDVPLHHVFVLLAEAPNQQDPILDHLKVDVIVTAFRPTLYRVGAKDVRALAALGAKTADSLEVLSGITVAEVLDRVSRAALAGLSLRDLRTIIEGIAFDTAERAR